MYFFEGKRVSSKMRSIHNAVSNMLDDLGMNNTVSDRISTDPNNPNRSIVLLKSKANVLTHGNLVFEVIDTGDNPIVCVLSSENVSQRTMQKIMDTLMDNLVSPVS